MNKELKPCLYALKWPGMKKPNRLTVYDTSGKAFEYMSRCQENHLIEIVPLVEFDEAESELQSLRAENERLSSALKIAIETFQKYEMDVEEYPTIEHINMMNALYSALKDSNNE